MTLEIREVPFGHPHADELRRAQRAELLLRYGRPDHEAGTEPTADDTPHFFVAYLDGHPLGCGGLRPLAPEVLGDGVAEIKRMFVRPDARGTGVAAALLRRIEEAAVAHGLHRVVLETGTGQPDALRFYTREGYRPISRFGPYRDDPSSHCFEWSRTAS